MTAPRFIVVRQLVEATLHEKRALYAPFLSIAEELGLLRLQVAAPASGASGASGASVMRLIA